LELIPEYTRKLPHIQPLYETFFITFRLHGCLPSVAIKNLAEERMVSENRIKNTVLNKNKKRLELLNNNKRNLIKFDNLLHKYQSDKDLLLNKKYANIVENSLHFYDNKNYELIAYCIMPNHVHLLVENVNTQLFRVLQSIKSFTAKKINEQMNKSGKIWQRESYDHIVRKNSNIEDYINYILQNPVKAGLVKNAENWDYSYRK